MKCPFCLHVESKVQDTRPTEEGTSIRRRRACLACGKRFTTYEKLEGVPLVVVKKNGQREVFDSDKLTKGIIKSCEKRPVELAKVEQLVQDIEKELYNTMDREVSTRLIGELVMERLQKLDAVAYVRFASVYREFKDIDSFLTELQSLLDKDVDRRQKAHRC
ncbi:MAG: transcriptional regulator NrdR [Clostridia bacterium]|jgi:transcriptional repressor NrdR|nr:transcriptional regulator NrdR [Clostridia bacterium]